jgi:hypothetical protein
VEATSVQLQYNPAARNCYLVSPRLRLLLSLSDLISGTGWYDQALSEAVLEELDFATVKPDM